MVNRVGVDFEHAATLARQLQGVSTTTIEQSLPKLQAADEHMATVEKNFTITGQTDFQDALQALLNAESNLDTSVSTLTTALPQLIDAVQGDVEPSAHQTIEKWKTDFTRFGQDVQQLKTTGNALKQNLEELTRNLNQLKATVADLQQAIKPVQDDLGNQKLPSFIQWCSQMQEGMEQGIRMWQ